MVSRQEISHQQNQDPDKKLVPEQGNTYQHVPRPRNKHQRDRIPNSQVQITDLRPVHHTGWCQYNVTG